MTASAEGPLVLGLDAATPPASVALVRGCDLLASATGPFGPGTDAWIIEGVETVLGEAGVSLAQVDRIASSTGPGTFTGIRVGIATAGGLARGIGAATIGISTLEALVEAAFMASDGAPDSLLAIVDARRGQLYAALSTANTTPAAGMTFEWGPDLLTPGELVDRIGDSSPLAAGTGTAVYERVLSATRRIDTGPLASSVARLAAAASDNRLPALRPFYFRPVDAIPGPSPLRDRAARPAIDDPNEMSKSQD